MRPRLYRFPDRLGVAAVIGLAIGGSVLASGVADARASQLTVSPARAQWTDVSAARKQRHTRRPPIRNNADSMASQPPDRPSFGYGVGDNSTYGGG